MSMTVVGLVVLCGAPQSFDAYLAEVARSNLSAAAQRSNVPLSEAAVVIARLFPDPVLTAGLASLDVSGVGAQNNLAASLTVPFEWPARRPARIAAAEANASVVSSELEDFLRLLRASAATAWVDAVFAERVVLRKQEAAASLSQLAEVNEERRREGAVSEFVMLQSRVEARRARSELKTAEGELRAARLSLTEFLGDAKAAPVEAHADLAALKPRILDVDALLALALEHRPDLRARGRGRQAAEAAVTLAHANRGLDVAANVGWLYYSPGVPGSAFQAPAFHTINALLSVPLPFSRIYDGEVRAAVAGKAQALAQEEATVLKVNVEVRAALARYEAARERLKEFDQQLLADNDHMLEMARYSYTQGASRLMELLSAQRTWGETVLAHESALADHARALIALQTATNAWDVSF